MRTIGKMYAVEFEAFARLMGVLLNGWPVNDQGVIDTAGRRILFALLHRPEDAIVGLMH